MSYPSPHSPQAPAAAAALIQRGRGSRPIPSGCPLTTSYPHDPDFAPDERAISIGVRARAGRIAERTDRAQDLPGGSDVSSVSGDS
ncbi:hypothetical protein [Streptomyces albospinus]|uniref:hypothetical protein n=1 Tax=Streptomyces albospinus TaxID=285515 RepID=UPI0027E3C762|nr:hypothetical protein [Streptomyces albospinus]